MSGSLGTAVCVNVAGARVLGVWEYVPHTQLEWLIIKWPGLERSWSRWAHETSRFAIDYIAKESLLVEAVPDWRDIDLSWDELHQVPQAWKDALRHWRGVYYIFDTELKLGYVGFSVR